MVLTVPAFSPGQLTLFSVVVLYLFVCCLNALWAYLAVYNFFFFFYRGERERSPLLFFNLPIKVTPFHLVFLLYLGQWEKMSMA